MTLVRKRSQIRSCRSLTPEIEFLSCLLLFPVLRYDEGFHHIINIDTSPVVITQMMERNMDRRRIGTDPYLFVASLRGRVVRTLIEVLLRVDRQHAAPVNMATIFPCLYSEIFTTICAGFCSSIQKEESCQSYLAGLWFDTWDQWIFYVTYTNIAERQMAERLWWTLFAAHSISYRRIKGLSNFGTPDVMDSSNEQWTSRLNGPENSTEIVNTLDTTWAMQKKLEILCT